jgi:hypothetical protein
MISTTVKEQVNQQSFLLSLASLNEYLGFLRHEAINLQDVEVRDLVEEWKLAQGVFQALAVDEAGIANEPEILEVPAEHQAYLEEVTSDPVYRKSFGLAPTEVRLVNLEQLISVQRTVYLSHATALRQKLSEKPGLAEVLRFCLPNERPISAVKSAQLSGNSFVFMSPVMDFRFIEPTLLAPEQILDYTESKLASMMLGLTLGFGAGHVNAISYKGRLILLNGNHRCYVLRSLGLRHVPMAIQYASSLQEIKLIAGQEICDQAEGLVNAVRPPMFKDHFNPDLHRVVQTQPKQRQVKISFHVEQIEVPAGF